MVKGCNGVSFLLVLIYVVPPFFLSPFGSFLLTLLGCINLKTLTRVVNDKLGAVAKRMGVFLRKREENITHSVLLLHQSTVNVLASFVSAPSNV